MDFDTVLGIGTFALLGLQGWILWRQTKIINSQKEISERQTKYLMRKEDPQIEVQKKEYKEDNIELNLINLGKTKAVGVAIKTDVLLVNPDIIKDKDQILINNVGGWDMKKQYNIKDGEKIYSLAPVITEIFYDKNNYPELEINQNHKFVQQLHFGLFDGKDKMPMPVPHKHVSFKELISLLKSNNVLGSEIKISLIYKNLSNEVVEEKLIDKIYIMPLTIKAKYLSELQENEKVKGGMMLQPIHPFMKNKFDLPKTEESYRQLNHCDR